MRKSHGVTDTRKTRLSAARAWTVTLCSTKRNKAKGGLSSRGVESHPSWHKRSTGKSVSAARAWKFTLLQARRSTLRGSQQPWRGKSRFVVQTQYQKACLSSPGLEIHLSFVIVMHRNADKFVSGARRVVVVVVVVVVVAVSSSGGGSS